MYVEMSTGTKQKDEGKKNGQNVFGQEQKKVFGEGRPACARDSGAAAASDLVQVCQTTEGSESPRRPVFLVRSLFSRCFSGAHAADARLILFAKCEIVFLFLYK